MRVEKAAGSRPKIDASAVIVTRRISVAAFEEPHCLRATPSRCSWR
jgi:hypothetical protein